MSTFKCATRDLKTKGAFKAIKKASLFSGTIHFVDASFGGIKLSSADLNAAIQYATLAIKQITQYCSAYGANSLAIDSTPISFSVATTTFNDAELQGYVNQILTQNNLPTNDALIFLCPQGVTNTDAQASQGVLGYHGHANVSYCFVNLLGVPLTVNDSSDFYAVALSHEIAEMTVDPMADLSEPEVCDPCAGNCGVDYRNYFDVNGKWLGGSPVSGYAFFIDGIATLSTVSQCPSPANACTYSPSSPPPPSPPSPYPSWLQALINFINYILSKLGL